MQTGPPALDGAAAARVVHPPAPLGPATGGPFANRTPVKKKSPADSRAGTPRGPHPSRRRRRGGRNPPWARSLGPQVALALVGGRGPAGRR